MKLWKSKHNRPSYQITQTITNFSSLSHTHTFTVSLIPFRNKIGNNTIYLFISIQVINKFTHKHTQKQFITNVKVISFNTLFNVKLHSLLPFHWSDAMVNKLLLIVFYIRSKHIRIYESERSNSCPPLLPLEKSSCPLAPLPASLDVLPINLLWLESFKSHTMLQNKSLLSLIIKVLFVKVKYLR